MPIHINVPRMRFEDCIFITGFHGIGATGYIAVSHLIDSLKAKRIGYVETDLMPPFVTMANDRLVTPFEIYKLDCFVFMKSEFPPHRDEEITFAKALAEWVVTKRFKEAVLIGGLDNSFKTGDSSMRVVSTKAFSHKVRVFGAPFLEPGLYVTGPLAVMLTVFEANNFPAIAILPYAALTRPDPSAAAVAIDKICRVYGLNVDVSSLIKDASEIEVELQERRERARTSYEGLWV
ncbi:MAG: PAC2 family protein [Halobacteria archaeon]|nr:proteasome assembly chaperone family protein [Candidatus Bathyarchaeota archaeon]